MRAFVAGESLWSKAQKDAIYALSRYVDSGSARDLARFEQARGKLRVCRRIDPPAPRHAEVKDHRVAAIGVDQAIFGDFRVTGAKFPCTQRFERG